MHSLQGVFAEAGKDFVDILISFLTLPLGTIDRVRVVLSYRHHILVTNITNTFIE
jgi:hypothetical protein